MAGSVLETFELGMQWPTLDPFLFCVHHDDAYPEGNRHLAPKASLAGRHIGHDFAGKDGWNMYHGSVVPGFPQHPHRGFETISFVRRGYMDHADSLGAAARFGRGDVQWMTAGAGIVHSEMFPLLDTSGPNPVELFQIWINLPAANKLVEPHFSMLWDDDIPRHVEVDSSGGVAEVTVVAGAIDDKRAPAPPPSSWASDPDNDVAIWHFRLDDGASWSVPPASHHDTRRALYVYEGGRLSIDGHELPANIGALVRSDLPVSAKAIGGAVEGLVLQGRPIGEPTAQHGPFVMNTRAEIEQAFVDYQRTRFGGWPWPVPDPNHGPEPRRFACHADGRTEAVSAG